MRGTLPTTYTYNADGIRTGKNVGGTAVEYMLDGSQILAEKNGSTVLRYFYDTVLRTANRMDTLNNMLNGTINTVSSSFSVSFNKSSGASITKVTIGTTVYMLK